jgi:hypothetical protein
MVLGIEFKIEPRPAIGDDAPGLRCICETMTRSVPLMMKVPFLVMSGMSPM